MKINSSLLNARWPAQWISCPGTLLTEFGVFHFRKTFFLRKKPAKVIVHVSADNRYRLFVNGKSVCFGPARGDIDNWRFETVDISSFLKKGRNCIASVVWNFGRYKPAAQFSRFTAFLFQTDDRKYSFLNTDASWKVFKNSAYFPFDTRNRSYVSYVGPGEGVQGIKYPWNWERVEYNDKSWDYAKIVDSAESRSNNISHWGWSLYPRNIPLMEETPVHFGAVRRSSGIKPGNDFAKGKISLKIPSRSKVSFLLDQTVLTTAYLNITLGGGKGSRITLTYAEAFKDKDRLKHNRNDVEGMEIEGYKDVFISDGGKDRTYQTLWWRTYRYVQVEIETKAKALEIKDIHGIYTGYPFKENGSFTSNDPELKNVWNTGWRTARLCAHENYIDCPYYEQLQYVGDTRIQALISLYVSGDDRLFKNAIEQIDDSRNSEGITRSSYPRVQNSQIIPPFSLYWIAMVHDYFMHRPDPAFVEKYLYGIYSVLNWYENKLDGKTGLLGAVPYWNFVDWTNEWPWNSIIGAGGEPAGGNEGGSSIITLHLAYTLDMAAEIFSFFKDKRAAHYSSVAAKLKKAVLKACWDKKRKLLADTPAKTSFSQHANINAVLAGAFSKKEAKEIMQRVITDKSLIQCSFYFRFYLNRALKKAGLADKYIEMLAPWKAMIKNGLTTFAEVTALEWTRSDCHAWSSSPNYDLLATVIGIEPACEGFKKVKIEPHLGNLKYASGIFPHPKGKIKAEFQNSEGKITGKITLPKGLTGKFISRSKTVKLKSGITII